MVPGTVLPLLQLIKKVHREWYCKQSLKLKSNIFVNKFRNQEIGIVYDSRNRQAGCLQAQGPDGTNRGTLDKQQAGSFLTLPVA